MVDPALVVTLCSVHADPGQGDAIVSTAWSRPRRRLLSTPIERLHSPAATASLAKAVERLPEAIAKSDDEARAANK